MAAKLGRNIGYLSLSQIANYIFPLLTIPYVTRVVGPENYGLVEFATTVLLYFIVVVDYSFHTTATRKIAAITNAPEKVNYTFSAVMWSKLLLFSAALLVFTILMLLIPQFRDNAVILWMAFPIILGWALYPNFLFFGLQKVGVIAFTNVLIKGAAAALIFIFIKDEGDYYYVPFLNGITQLVVAGATLWYAFKKIETLKWLSLKWRSVKVVLQEGKHIFLSHFFTRIYGFGSILIGGFLLTPLELGLFAAASKLINVAQSFLLQPLHGALFPHLSKQKNAGLNIYLKAHTKSLLLLAVLCLGATLFTILLAPWLIKIIFGTDYSASTPLLRIMAPMLLTSGLAHMFLQQGLLILRKDKVYMYIIIFTGISSILLNLWLISVYSITGAAIVRLSTEVLIALCAGVFFYRKLKQE